MLIVNTAIGQEKGEFEDKKDSEDKKISNIYTINQNSSSDSQASQSS